MSELFIQRPITTTLIMAGIVLFGLIGYQSLPVSDLPNVDYPTIQVSAELPGASPETMASSVATPLERQFSTIAGLNTVSSTSTLGNTQITLQFDLSRNIDAAAQDVQTAISASARQLPPGMPSQPTLKKVNPADQPIVYLMVSSPTLALSKVNEFADTSLAQRLSTISGVAQVLVTGEQKYAVRAQLDPSALASRGIGIDDVATALQRGNTNLPVGTLYGIHQNLTVQANGQLMDAESYRQLIIAIRLPSWMRFAIYCRRFANNYPRRSSLTFCTIDRNRFANQSTMCSSLCCWPLGWSCWSFFCFSAT